MPDREVLGADAIAREIEELASAIACDHPAGRPLNVIGILTRGETLAARLRSRLAQRKIEVRRGVLDVTLYRDDLSEIGPRPLVRPTDMNLEVDGIPMLVVDDVIHTGRSIRAALEAITDFGRPAYVRLAVLIDRGGRELPIQPDYVRLRLEPPAGARVNVLLRENDGRDGVEVSEGGRP
jgi:pyrimidine operon attenuation protein/uracil phosphoribosyltransferase